jgi:deoxyribonuclease-4
MTKASPGDKGPRLGAHLSIGGGLHRAIERGEELGCEVVQLFTHSNQQWAMKPLSEEQLERWRSVRAAARAEPVLVHASYLINLASSDEPTRSRSCEALAAEYERCQLLEIPFLVLHPGAHLGRGEAEGIGGIAEALSQLFDQGPDNRTTVLLENTAGQGTGIGHRFEHLRDIFSAVEGQERLGVCFDTCHAFAAGYELRTAAGWDQTFAALDEAVGLDRLKAFHVNDSKRERASRVDRHDHLGRGFLGLGPFRRLVNDSRFLGLPMVLETPKPSSQADQVNLGILRDLVGRSRVTARAKALAATEL